MERTRQDGIQVALTVGKRGSFETESVMDTSGVQAVVGLFATPSVDCQWQGEREITKCKSANPLEREKKRVQGKTAHVERTRRNSQDTSCTRRNNEQRGHQPKPPASFQRRVLHTCD